MIILIVTGLILLLTVYLTLNCCIIPKRKYNRYLETIKKLGYTVHAIPFKPFSIPFLAMEKESLEKYNDSCRITKEIAPACDLILTNSFNTIMIILTSADLIKEYFNPDKVEHFEKTKTITLGLSKFAGKGLFLSQGNQWKIKRKILSKVFNFDLVKANIPQIAKICDSSFENMEAQHSSQQNQIKESGIAIASTITNRVMMKCFFGEDDIKQKIKGNPFSVAIVETIQEAIKVGFSPFVILLGDKAIKWNIGQQIKDFNQTIAIFNTICKSIVQRRTLQIEAKLTNQGNRGQDRICNDILEALILQRKRCEANGEAFIYSDQDIVQQFATFIAAGTDTTSNFIQLMLYYICTNPHIEERVRKQIAIHIQTQDDFTYEKLKQLTFLDCVQKETSRFYGPATFLVPKKLKEDVYISDIPILKGTLLSISLFGCHYRKSFYENPEEFRPERWQQSCENPHPYAFIAFGGGPRACIGKQLANLQSKIIIVKMLMRYRHISVPQSITLVDGFVYFAEMGKIKFAK